MRILNALKANGVLRTRDLCNVVDRDRKVVWKNIHKLIEEGLVKKILIDKEGPIEKALWELKNNINSKDKELSMR
jgi:predicted transcriptional regulator